MNKNRQITDTLLMIRPANFGFNAETAKSNAFQQNPKNKSPQQYAELAIREFDLFVEGLRKEGVEVIVVDDSAEPPKPDAVFPNNWISFHSDGTVVLYPMQAPSRRLERRTDFLEDMNTRFSVSILSDLSDYEEDKLFLEGTGSMVFDRIHKVVYACLSPRTDEKVLEVFCRIMGYKPVTFRATDEKGQEIYHTNVTMALGEAFVVICLEAVKSESEKKALENSFKSTGKTIIPISMDQMHQFAGNMLEVSNNKGENLIVMSSKAYHSLTPSQLQLLSGFGKVFHSSLDTIETLGGGSARCMMAEVFLPKKE